MMKITEIVMQKLISTQKAQIEDLKYTSFLNAIEKAFRENRTGISRTDQVMLKFAHEVIGSFAAIYANSRDEQLGEEAQQVILRSNMHQN